MEEELLPLFALAFVERPQDHEEVKEVFNESWRQRLRRDVEVGGAFFLSDLVEKSRFLELKARI